jgi:SAM-dependent methyltransferase
MDNPFSLKWGTQTDSVWLQAMLAALQNHEVDGVAFPTLPDAETQRIIQGNSQEISVRGSMAFYQYVRDTARKHGRPVNENTRLLDFGSGWGRMVRPFMRDMDLQNIFAVEPSPEWCRIARRCNPYIGFHQIDYWPPTPFREGLFDHIIAYSIFTHLPEAMFDAWMDEFARILAPNGILIFTFLGVGLMGTLSRYPDPLPDDEPIHFWHRILINALKTQPHGLRRDRRSEFTFLRTHSTDTYGDTFIGPDVIYQKLNQKFTVLEIHDERLAQDVAVVQQN